MNSTKRKGFVSLLYNRLSFAGGIFAAIIFAIIILMIFVSLIGGGSSPYFGLVAFLLLPPFLFLGIILIPIGVLIERRKRMRTGKATQALFPVVDLNIKRHRMILSIFNTAVFGIIILIAVSSYKAYHFTETVSFCGTLCHHVMKPEYTAYERSPHARVRCVDCHVGPGASFYVKSKLSGLYQVYATLADVYPHPIPVPIKNLRPAQETCEQCHWPDAFFGGKQVTMTHFLTDKSNSRWNIEMLVKIGGGSPSTAQTTGIHWHMNIANKVEFIARDSTYQDIPWVKITNLKTGVSNLFQDTNSPLSAAEIDSLPRHRMDCMDCHNRPTHIFRSPSYSVNLALATRRIQQTLPDIKQNGVDVLVKKYASTDEALKNISQKMWQLYDPKNFPDTIISNASIEQAMGALQEIYSHNFFPGMDVRWDMYADNIGHLDYKGCFRCHGGSHQNESGESIPRECTTCHYILSQGSPGNTQYASNPEGLEFKHPEDIGEAWKEMGCYECHTGATP
jgi:hypothetical protein